MSPNWGYLGKASRKKCYIWPFLKKNQFQTQPFFCNILLSTLEWKYRSNKSTATINLVLLWHSNKSTAIQNSNYWYYSGTLQLVQTLFNQKTRSFKYYINHQQLLGNTLLNQFRSILVFSPLQSNFSRQFNENFPIVPLK